MRKLLSNILATVVLSACCLNSHAQVDPHFSQYYSYAAWLNPGLTGVIDGDYRVMGIYRNQWAGVSNAFSTPGISADMATNKNLNFGINVMNQSAGSGGYNYLNSYLSLAYTGVKFGVNGYQRLSFGISGGVINRKFNPSKFQYGDQWNSFTGFSNANPGSETLNTKSSLTFDMGAGLMYYDADPNKKANLFLGFSAFHLTQPEDPFLSNGTHEKIPVRYTAHGGVKIAMSDNVSLTPNLLYMKQGDAEEKMMGAYVQLKASDITDVLLGANYRFKDAISPYIGFYYRNMILGASYDVNASDLGSAVGTGKAGSFELSLSFIGRKGKTNYPEHFVCPRL